MTASDTVEAGRAFALEQMIDSCVIAEAAAGLGTFNSHTGVYTPPAETPIYSGPCQVQVTDSLAARTPDAGETLVTLQRLIVKVPLTATGIKVNHRITITAVGEGSDPELLGRGYRIEATHAKTYATARRLQCEEVTSP